MTDNPPPTEPTETPAAEPVQTPAAPQPQPSPTAAAPAYVPAPFPQVLRTPWVNPAKRAQLLLAAVLTVLAVAAAAFVTGLAVGDDGRHGDRVGPELHVGDVCMYAPAVPNAKCAVTLPGRPYRLRPGQMKPRKIPSGPREPSPVSPSPSK